MRPLPPKLREPLFCVMLAGGAAFFMLQGLDRRPLADMDEGIHAAVSLEMVRSGEWVSPSLAGAPYFRKPPLKLWLTALLFGHRGQDLWSVRLPSALSGVLLALIAGLWVRRWSGSRLQGLLSGLAVASMRPIFFHAFRTGEMDGMLALFVAAALVAWWRARHGGGSRRWMAALGVALGLAVMTKSAAGLLPLPVIALDALAPTRRAPPAGAILPRRSWALAALAFVAVAAPWHVVMALRHGRAFFDRYVGVEVVQRASESLFGVEKGPWWYLRQIVPELAPYVFWLAPALLFALREVLARAEPDGTGGPAPSNAARKAALRLCLLWFAVAFTTVSAMETRTASYLLLAHPAAIVLVVHFLLRARPAAGDWLASFGHAAALWSLAAFGPPAFVDPARWRALREGAAGILFHPMVLGAAAVLAAALAVRILRRWIDARLLGGAVFSLVLAAALAIYVREATHPRPESPLAALARGLDRTPTLWVAHGHRMDAFPAAYFHLLANPAVSVAFASGSLDPLADRLAAAPRAFVVGTEATVIPPVLAPLLHRRGAAAGYVLWSR